MIIKRTTQFKKDFKRISKRNKNIDKLKVILNLLINSQELPNKNKDHNLIGNYIGCRECHIEPDWLLIYQIKNLELILIRTGSHSDLFNN